jgi:hypothetical protein
VYPQVILVLEVSTCEPLRLVLKKARCFQDSWYIESLRSLHFTTEQENGETLNGDVPSGARSVSSEQRLFNSQPKIEVGILKVMESMAGQDGRDDMALSDLRGVLLTVHQRCAADSKDGPAVGGGNERDELVRHVIDADILASLDRAESDASQTQGRLSDHLSPMVHTDLTVGLAGRQDVCLAQLEGFLQHRLSSKGLLVCLVCTIRLHILYPNILWGVCTKCPGQARQ